MLGKIISINGNILKVELAIDVTNKTGLSNLHVAIECQGKKLIGEIIEIDLKYATISLLGEIINNQFISGVNTKPSFASTIRIITKDELNQIIDFENSNYAINFGRLPLYSNYPINLNPDIFFSNHSAIVGNSGSGKSSAVARLFQNIFSTNIRPKSNMFIFDVFGEYENALAGFNGINYKSYTTDLKDQKNEIIKIPVHLLNIEDLALLLQAENFTQLPIIEKMLRVVTIFNKTEEEQLKCKNDIIARAIKEILYSGKTAAQIRDQIIAILTSFPTKTLNTETQVVVPGWTRTLKQCLQLDKENKISEMQLVSEFIGKFISNDIELNLPNGEMYYTLENLYEALELAFISEGTLKSDAIYDKVNSLKVRLKSLIDGEFGMFFRYDKYISKEDYVKSLNNDGKNPIVNFNINSITDRQAKIVIKILSKMLLESSFRVTPRGSRPIHIFIEEAHRYVQNDIDVELLGYNIFEKIAKEGRKYGVILCLITQRPSELSDTTLSQASNYIIFRLNNPTDIEYVRKIVPNITDEMIMKIKSLQPGFALMFGSAFKIPLTTKFDLPNPRPNSDNISIKNTWYK
ncbi:MAG: ATP-binding protein [Bacilli bacterium]|nr:ATP-binding protein [Bacilli bacterium]